MFFATIIIQFIQKLSSLVLYIRNTIKTNPEISKKVL